MMFMDFMEVKSTVETREQETGPRTEPHPGDRQRQAEPPPRRAPVHHYNPDYFRTRSYGKRPLGRFSMYWFARRYYAALLRRFAPAKGGTLLEVGSGLGHLLGLLQDDFQCTGIDFMDYAVQMTSRHAPRARVLQGDANQPLQFETGEFSVVTALHLVEHLERPREFVGEVARILQPDGLFLFVTPHPTYPLRQLKDPATDATGIDPTHINVHPPTVWRAWCAEFGFRIERHFGDGLWDVPYLPLLPTKLQFALFGWPALIQVLMKGAIIPLDWGVNQIVIARKPPQK